MFLLSYVTPPSFLSKQTKNFFNYFERFFFTTGAAFKQIVLQQNFIKKAILSKKTEENFFASWCQKIFIWAHRWNIRRRIKKHNFMRAFINFAAFYEFPKNMWDLHFAIVVVVAVVVVVVVAVVVVVVVVVAAGCRSLKNLHKYLQPLSIFAK